MHTLRSNSRDFEKKLAAFCRTSRVAKEISDAVSAILAGVLEEGDVAVSRYAAQFDKAHLRPAEFRVRPREFKAARRKISPTDWKALVTAHAQIEAFHRRNQPKAWNRRNGHGARVGEKFDPIRRVGLYVPGGQVPLVSTVLMTATLAKIAGCAEIAVFTPSNAAGQIADGLLAALLLVGINEVYRVGGVHAIGAMAYGTRAIAAVDKIYGPGNAYVCEAKRQVFGTVGVDSLPGPSELMVIADESARPAFAAADLLAQAEHGSGREKVYLVGTSAAVIADIVREIETQLKTLTRAEKARAVLVNGFLAIEVRSLDEAAAVANYVAPEHLELLVRRQAVAPLKRTVTTAGAMMVGNYTPAALGDFVAGPSHVLPTARTGRFFSGLRLEDFLRRTSVVEYSRESLRRAAPIVAAFAALERIDAHGRSVQIRL